MARKVNTKEPRTPRTIVVGAGLTEFWYLKHLKRHNGYNYVLRPSLFGDESMQTIQSRIYDVLETGATAVCVFDEDVRQWNETESKRLEEIHRKYKGNSKVILASSMPSIEYWLLLHFENTNRYFGTSSKTIEALKKHLTGFDKKEHYLKQDKWMAELLAQDKMETAYSRAKFFGHSGPSYSDFWKAVETFKDKT